GVGVRRAMQVTTPARAVAWMLVAESDGMPRVLDEKGEVVMQELKPNGSELPVTCALVAVQPGGRPALLHVTAAAKNTTWFVHRTGKTWQVMLRLPSFAEPMMRRADVAVWVPHRDEPELLKELL